MESFTGIPGPEWVVAQLYAMALVLVVGSALWRVPGRRVHSVLVVPFVVGVAGVAIVFALFRSETRSFAGDLGERRASLAVAAAVLLVAIAVADFLVSRVAPFGARGLGARAWATDAALAAALVVPAAFALAIAVQFERGTVSSEASQGVSRARIAAEFELPGQPMDVELRSRSEGFVTLDDGTIRRFTLPEGPDRGLELAVAARGLESPRGLAVVGDTLVVAELGPLPCAKPFPCKGENVGGVSRDEGELRILRESNGRLVGFDVGVDGGLTARRVIRDRLPVANSDHAVNGVVAGPDGRVYVTVGNLDRLVGLDPGTVVGAASDLSLLGVVFSIRPDGGDFRVHARGLRNVYDLAFDDAGRLYGVDNDGDTRRGWRREEVLQLLPGADYGYPADGTFGPYTRRTTPPLWVLDTAGSAGIEWTRASGVPTLLVGSCSDVYAVALSEVDGSVTVRERDPVRHLLRVSGCVTAVEHLSGDRYAMTLFGFGSPGHLVVVELAG